MPVIIMQHKLQNICLACFYLDANSHFHIFSHKIVFIFIGYIHNKLYRLKPK